MFTQCVTADILMKLNFCIPGVPLTEKVVPTPTVFGAEFSVGRVARLPSALNKVGGVYICAS